MQNDKAINENPYVCKQVLEMVGKPDNFHMCKGMNVYDDRYRVNIYVREDVEDLTGHKLYIKDSYFCRLDNDKVTILSQPICKDRGQCGSQPKRRYYENETWTEAL